MIYYIGSRKLDISKKELDRHYYNEGTESTVYLFDDKVLKIHKPFCKKRQLSEDEVKILSEIKTERIVMPEEVIYNELGRFSGYTMKYINPELIFDIKNMKIKKFSEEVEKYESDIRNLSENKVSVTDLHIDNFILNNNELYFIDPGSFFCEENLIDYKNTKDEELFEIIEQLKREEMNEFFIKNILERYSKIPYKSRKILETKLNITNSLSKQIKDTMIDDETLKEYTRRMVK